MDTIASAVTQSGVPALVSLTGMPVSKECCTAKAVGGIQYKLVQEYSIEVPAQCSTSCIYEQKGSPNSRYCFAPGSLPVKCLRNGLITNKLNIAVRGNVLYQQTSTYPNGEDVFICVGGTFTGRLDECQVLQINLTPVGSGQYCISFDGRANLGARFEVLPSTLLNFTLKFTHTKT